MPIRLQFDVDLSQLKNCPEEVKNNRQLDDYNLDTGVVIEYRKSYYDFEEISEDRRIHVGIVSTHENITAVIDAYCNIMGVARESSFEPSAALYLKEASNSLRRLITANAKVQCFSDPDIAKILVQQNVKLTMDHIARTTASSYRGCSSAAFVSTNFMDPIATECMFFILDKTQ